MKIGDYCYSMKLRKVGRVVARSLSEDWCWMRHENGLLTEETRASIVALDSKPEWLAVDFTSFDAFSGTERSLSS